MPVFDRLILCSFFAATVIYALYRRKRRSIIKQHDICEELNDSREEHCQYISLFHSPEARIIAEAERCVEFSSFLIPAVAKVTFTNVCLLEPVLHTEQVSLPVAVTEVVPTMAQQTNQMVDITIYERGSASSDSSSDHPLTPDSQDSSSGDLQESTGLPPGYFDDPLNDIYEDNPEELNGTMLPKVLIPSDLWAEAVDKDIWHETFCVPAHMGGVLIGRLGKNVRELKNIWQAEFSLNTCPGRQDTLIFKLSCPIKHKDDVLQWVSRRFRMRPSKTPIGNPNQLKRFLPLGEAVPVHVRSLYASKEFFVTIRDEQYDKYLKMQSELDADYSAATNYRIQLCEPVTSGTVAVVPHSQGFARALVISVYPTWPKSIFYFLLDHGIFGVVALNKLRKIRAKYMRTPFQAIHVSWAHAFPVFSDVPDIHILRTFFSSGRIHAFAVRMETCCRASVAFGEPYPQPYSSSGMLDILLNAYNSGLYMAVPLMMYPNRQAWLNGSSIPYYPFSYSAIDYPSLVSFVEEDSNSPIGDLDHEELPGCQSHISSRQRGADPQKRTNMNTRPRAARGGSTRPVMRRPFISNQRTSGRGGHLQSSIVSQKENENVTNHTVGKTDSTTLRQLSGREGTPGLSEPKPKPLGVRNARGNNTGCVRNSVNRGRGFVRPH